MSKLLVIGSAGQLGIELVLGLQAKCGAENVLVTDIRVPDHPEVGKSPFIHLDATDREGVESLLATGEFSEVYHLAAMLSAVGEKKPQAAWDLNMKSLLIVLECARKGMVSRVFWPSSIAVFGPFSPADCTPQDALTDPTTVYGISKVAGEQWCRYYHAHYGVDVRSLRYPGLIGHRSEPGGGTTDYAVSIFDAAIAKEAFTCFLEADESLPMMYMEDAVRATIELMAAPESDIAVRTSYNLDAMSFTPAELAQSIQQRIPGFTMTYDPDERQAIAATWPNSVDDSPARKDWGWAPNFLMDDLVDTMLVARRAARKSAIANAIS